MATTKFTPPAPPGDTTPGVKQYLDEQMRRLAVLVNNSAQVTEDEIVSGDWTFNGAVTINTTTVDINATLDVDGLSHDISGQRLRGILTADVQFTTPLFVVIDDADPKIRLQVGGTERAFLQYVTADTETVLDSDGHLSLRTNNTERIRIVSNGDFRFMDAAGTDFMSFRHDGADMLAIGTNTRFLRFTGLDRGVRIENGGPLNISERAAADTHNAGFGQLWVKNTTPCQLWFTDDAGTDTQIV